MSNVTDATQAFQHHRVEHPPTHIAPPEETP